LDQSELAKELIKKIAPHLLDGQLHREIAR
jgi:hypothetical protein